MNLSEWLFVLLTVLHPIADYMIPLDKRIPWHYILVLNPLHFLWDETLGKKHSHFARHFKEVRQYHIYWRNSVNVPNANGDLITQVDAYFKDFKKPQDVDVISQPFWFWLGVDQLMHVILNLIFVLLLEQQVINYV